MDYQCRVAVGFADTPSRGARHAWRSQVSAAAHPNAVKLAQGPMERRERRPVALQGYAALDDGRTAEILVLDLSYDGCGIAIPIELQPERTIKLSVLGRGAIDAIVRWYANGKAGLIFKAEEPAGKQHHPRSTERLSLTADVSMRRLGRINYRVRLFDLSAKGCKVEFIERPRVGEHVMVKFDGLEPLESEVCWVERYCGGLRFERSFHPAVFDLIAARLAGVGADE